MKNLFYLLVLIILFAGNKTSYAQLDNSLVQEAGAFSVLGLLRGSNGTTVDNGEYSINFTLWNHANSNDANDRFWSQMISAVSIEGGMYSVILEDDPSQPPTAELNVPYYLGVRIGGGTEFAPSSRWTYSPYASSLLGTDNKSLLSTEGKKSVIDLLGRVMQSQKLELSQGNKKVRILAKSAEGNSLRPGLYLVKIETDKWSGAEKVLL